jgi:hypothetical protein
MVLRGGNSDENNQIGLTLPSSRGIPKLYVFSAVLYRFIPVDKAAYNSFVDVTQNIVWDKDMINPIAELWFFLGYSPTKKLCVTITRVALVSFKIISQVATA